MITVLGRVRDEQWKFGCFGNKKISGTSHRNEDKTINLIRSRDGGRVRNDCKRPKRLPQRNGGAQAKSETRQRSHFS